MGENTELGWIEVFHSQPSFRRCFIVFKKDDEEWVNNATYELVSAEHIRKAYRVFRVYARKLEYYLTNGSNSNWDDNHGANYHIGLPGRYVCGQGVFTRIGDPDTEECERFLRSKDTSITFRTDHVSEKMYAFYRTGNGNTEWVEMPGTPMTKDGPGLWKITIPARTVEVAFTDGAEYWDSNMDKNYLLGTPGKYLISAGNVEDVNDTPTAPAVSAPATVKA